MQLLSFAANLPICTIAMDASYGAHNLGRILTGHGYQVRLIPAQFVRPFVNSNKNDYVDAEAIAEAVQRPTMRFVLIKTEDQLDLQALRWVRDRFVSRRTGVINQLRAFLLERGITLRQGSRYLRFSLTQNGCCRRGCTGSFFSSGKNGRISSSRSKKSAER